MADRIFPNTYQEEPLDSDLVFKGIDWDNFNTKLAEVKDGLHTPELPEEFREVLAGKNDKGGIPQEVLDKWNEKKPKSKGNIADLPGDEDSGLEGYVRKRNKNKEDDDDEDVCKDCNKSSDKCTCKDNKPKKNVKAKECTCGKKPCTCGWAADKGNMKKKAFVFDHPSQISAEAIESAIAEGDRELANAILAARHERRVRLANKIETRVASENEKSMKLAQRRAYREALVEKVASQENKMAKVARNSSNEEFTKVSSLNNKAKKVFASKAIAQGFPEEYVKAILGTESKPADKTVEIRNVMASNLNTNTKKTVVANMVKEATLSDADYSRLINYWKNELGYGDQEWIDALFTKKYDK